MTDLSTLLNPEQFQAATAPDGPLLILAAAGTGKTRTLVYRVVHLIERGFHPYEILLITFTNRAAREMLSRAEEVSPGITTGLWGGTFHHIANRILRRYAPRLDYPLDFVILDADDQKTLMAQCIKANGFDPKKFATKELILSLISGAANRSLDLESYLEDKSYTLTVPVEQVVQVANSYTQKKTDLQAMDFDDLLVKSLDLLRQHDDVRAYYQNKFQHVLVDEYQDTNALQSEFVELLAAGHQNLSVVGDDFQCIYSWRGSDYQNIMQFPRRHPDAQVVKLERNYRSRPEILQVANASIQNNPNQFHKVLRPTRPSEGNKPRRYDLPNDAQQTEKVLSIIQEAKAEGYSYQDIAILYRSHFHSINTQIAFAKNRIPHAITSGTGFFEQAHAKDILALLRFCECPKDELAFGRFLTLIDGVGPATVEKIWKRLGERFTASDEDQRAQLRTLLPARARPQWAPLEADIAQYFENLATPTAAKELIDHFTMHFYEDYLSKSFENAQDRMDDINELALEIEKRGDVREFLADIALMTNLDREAEQADKAGEQIPRITLSTIHQAKGLEWPVVIILWAVEGLFPSQRALTEDEDDSEERRLFYVALTRAKEQLHIMTPRLRLVHPSGFMPCDPSRFVKEIPEELLETISVNPYGLSRPDAFGSNRPFSPPFSRPPSSYPPPAVGPRPGFTGRPSPFSSPSRPNYLSRGNHPKNNRFR